MMAGRSVRKQKQLHKHMKGKELEPSAYPPMPVCPVRPMPFDQLYPQFPLPEAIMRGTLFPWLYDPYHPEHCR